jgi:8-oxo-dGTP pyrophosphatase MutT (NUDIX family)
MHRQPLLNLLDSYECRFPAEAAVVERFRLLVNDYENCFERDCWAGHITGSAWLVDALGDRVLLTHHKKLGRWLQLGGHSDGEPNTLLAAQREAEEESGLEVVALDEIPLDLDVHEIPARKSDPAHFHFDVRFAFRVTGSEAFTVSDESHDLAWVPIDGLDRYTDEESVLRMARKWRSASVAP